MKYTKESIAKMVETKRQRKALMVERLAKKKAYMAQYWAKREAKSAQTLPTVRIDGIDKKEFAELFVALWKALRH